jgi:hypothetical protein
MTGVTRACILLAALTFTETACATKLPPPPAGEPYAQPIVLEDVPRHVDTILMPLQTELLRPIRETLRRVPVSTSSVASDGSYGKWLTEVTEAVVYARPLPKNLDQLSERAYRDLARIAGKPTKRGAAVLDFSLIARRLNVYFEKQPAEVRKTAAAYIESAYSIPG